jgi:hypothetical protein
MDTNRSFQFHKRSQLIIRVHNEALSVVAVRLQSRPFGRWNQSLRYPNSNRLLRIVGHLRRRFACLKLRTHLLDLRCLVVEARSELCNCHLEVLR